MLDSGEEPPGGARADWRFEPMRIDVLFSWFANKPPADTKTKATWWQRLPSRPRNGLQVALWGAAIVLLAWIATAAIGGRLSDIKAEANVEPVLHSIVSSIPGFVSSPTQAAHHDFPLFEDIASWLLAGASVITFGLLFRQWHIMGDVLPRLTKTGALTVDDANKERFTNLVDEQNRRMSRLSTKLALPLVAVGLSALVCLRLSSSGLYGTLAPPGATKWAGNAYQYWWAQANGWSWFGCVAFGLLLATYLYYLLAQYLAGAMWVVLTVRGSKLSKFRFDFTNMDGYFGWRPLRDLMITVYLSILVQMLALLPLLHLLTRNSVVYLVVPFGLFAVFNPIYVAIPWIIVSPQLREKRDRLQQKVAAAYVVPHTKDVKLKFDDQANVAQTHAYLRSMPVFPFGTRELAVGLVTYGLPVAAFLWHG